MDKKYWQAVLNKVIENLTSMKWWYFVTILAVSTKLVLMSLMTSGEFVTLNTTLLSIIVGMREIMKISKVKALVDPKEIEKIKS
jgi:hypothetical protein